MTTPSFSQQVLQRYEIIRLQLKDDVPLRQLADLHGCSERTLRQWVTSVGAIQIDRHTDEIGSAYQQQPVAAHVFGTESLWKIRE